MSAKSQVNKHDETLAKGLKRFNDSWDYASSHWHDKWDRDNKLRNNERVDAQYHGVTDTFVPMVFSTIETMVAALNNANLRIDYKSGNPLRQPSTAPLNALTDEWWEADQRDLAMEEMYREFLGTGMAVGMLSWEIDRPHLEHFAMRDAIVDPTIKSPSQLQQPGAYAGRRYLVRRETLDNFEVIDTDEKSKTYMESIKRFKVPEDAKNTKTPDQDDDKSNKELMSGSTLPDAGDQCELIEIWDVDRVVTIMNRKYVIEDIENPYKTRHRTLLKKQLKEQGKENIENEADLRAKGLVPFFFLRNYRETSLFYAKSEIDAIAKPQELLNDMTNMESDYIIRQLAPQRELDPTQADFLDLITNDPDVVYPFKPGTLVPIPPPVLAPNSFQNRMNIKNEMRETTAVDQLAKGIQNVKSTTATEVNTQMEQTSQRIESKARIIEKDGLYWLATIEFRMFQLFVDEPLVVQVKGQDTADLVTQFPDPRTGEMIELPKGAAVLDPADYQGDWRPSASLEMDAMSKQAEQRKAALESFEILIQDPTNNLDEIKKRLFPYMFPDLDREDLEAITTPDPNAAMAGAVDPMGAPMPADPGMAGAVPPPAPGMPPVAPPEAAGAPIDGGVDAEALMAALSPEDLALLQQEMAKEVQTV